jgi:hypothetical protein
MAPEDVGYPGSKVVWSNDLRQHTSGPEWPNALLFMEENADCSLDISLLNFSGPTNRSEPVPCRSVASLFIKLLPAQFTVEDPKADTQKPSK